MQTEFSKTITNPSNGDNMAAINAIPKTKKAAKALGLIPEAYLSRTTIYQVARRDAVPVVVKGERFFREEDLEEVMSKTMARVRGFEIPGDVQPVKECWARRYRKYFDVYRQSDLRPIVKTEDQLAREARIRENRSAAAERRELKRRDEERKERLRQKQKLADLLSAPIEIPVYSITELECRAQKNAEEVRRRREFKRFTSDSRYLERDCDFQTSDGDYDRGYSDSVYEHRISVNYLRHAHTDYDYICDLKKYGLDENEMNLPPLRISEQEMSAYSRRVFEAIAATYPHLATECARQLGRRDVSSKLITRWSEM